jgi:hypothetical protein
MTALNIANLLECFLQVKVTIKDNGVFSFDPYLRPGRMQTSSWVYRLSSSNVLEHVMMDIQKYLDDQG